MRVVFLALDEVLAMHADLIERHGGHPGIRDVGLLESALAAPTATFGGHFLHGTPAEMAAAYLHGLVRNHPFVDGNKRAGLMAAFAFLGLNGFQFDPDPNRPDRPRPRRGGRHSEQGRGGSLRPAPRAPKAAAPAGRLSAARYPAHDCRRRRPNGESSPTRPARPHPFPHDR